MKEKSIGKLDRRLAETCRACPLCRHARKTQKGIVFQFVKTVEGHICPACRAYEKVYGKKAHENE